MINWIKVDKSLPKIGKSILVYDVDKNDILICKLLNYGNESAINFLWFSFLTESNCSFGKYPLWAEIPDNPQEIMEAKKYLQAKNIYLKTK